MASGNINPLTGMPYGAPTMVAGSATPSAATASPGAKAANVASGGPTGYSQFASRMNTVLRTPWNAGRSAKPIAAPAAELMRIVPIPADYAVRSTRADMVAAAASVIRASGTRTSVQLRCTVDGVPFLNAHVRTIIDLAHQGYAAPNFWQAINLTFNGWADPQMRTVVSQPNLPAGHKVNSIVSVDAVNTVVFDDARQVATFGFYQAPIGWITDASVDVGDLVSKLPYKLIDEAGCWGRLVLYSPVPITDMSKLQVMHVEVLVAFAGGGNRTDTSNVLSAFGGQWSGIPVLLTLMANQA